MCSFHKEGALFQFPTKWNIPLVSDGHSIKCPNPFTAALPLSARFNQHHQTSCVLPRHELSFTAFYFRRHPSPSEKWPEGKY